MGASIWTKFGSLMQNNVQLSGKWSKSKPKVDFQYGGRLFFTNGSSYISADNWDMSTKFGLLIDFELLKTVTSTNTKPELLFSGRGRRLEKWKWRHISAYFSADLRENGSALEVVLHDYALHKSTFTLLYYFTIGNVTYRKLRKNRTLDGSLVYWWHGIDVRD